MWKKKSNKLIFLFKVPIWSSVHVGGMKLRDINPRIGDKNDPERWYELTDKNKESSKLINEKIDDEKNCWCLGLCTAEIVDAIIRNTKIVLPVSTYIHVRINSNDHDQ